MPQFGSFLIPILVLFGFVAFFGVIRLFARCYIKVPPDMVAVITGRKRKLPDGRRVGYRLVRGGATLVLPVVEQVKYLPLRLITLQIEVKEAYNKNGVPVTIEAVANVKIKGEDTAIANAVERFLEDKIEVTSQKIEKTTLQTLEGHLRSIVGTMTIEDLNSDRKTFAQKVTEESVQDLEKMGITADSIVIKKIADLHGYLEALGKKRTAEVKRDAEIGEAQAKSEAKKATTDALREAELIAAENERKIAEAQKNLAVQKAVYDAETSRQQATAAQAGPQAEAEARKAVVVAQQGVEQARAEAAVKVQDAERLRKEMELRATVIVQAEAENKAAVIKADGEATARMRTAEGTKQALTLEADGKAAQTRAQGLAEADANKAKLLAEAEANRAKLVAVADGTRAQLLAEAEGKEKLAKALKELNEVGQLLFLLEKSPDVIRAIGDAGGEIAKNVFQSLAAPLGSIDHLTVYDSGSHDGKGAVNRLAGVVPNVLFDFIQQCKANGLELGDLVEKLVSFAGSKLASGSVPPSVPPAGAK